MVDKQIALFTALVEDAESGGDRKVLEHATQKLAELVLEFAGHLNMVGNGCYNYRRARKQ